MKITLEEKGLADGMISLFLEYYKGSAMQPDGKRKHLRDFEYLRLYLTKNPKTAAEKEKEKKKNKETMELADQILAIRQTEYI